MESEEDVKRGQEKAQREEEERRKQAPLWNIDDAVKQAQRIREIQSPILGTVRYGMISLQDVITIQKKVPDDPALQSLMMIHGCLSKADPFVTLEKLKALPGVEGSELVRLFNEEILTWSRGKKVTQK